MSIMRSRRVNPWFASPYTCCSFSLVERGHQCILKGGGRWQKVWDQLHASKCCSCLMRRSVRSRLEQESQACTWRDANTLNQTPTSIIELDDMFDSIEKNIRSSKLIYLRFTLTANDYNQSKEPLSSLFKYSSTTSLSSLSLPPSWPEPLIQRKGNEVIEKNKLGTSGCILTALLCIFTAQQWAICTMSNMSKITVESLIVQANEHLPKRGCRKLEMYVCCCCCCCFRSVGFVSFKAVWTENWSEANRPYQTLSRVLLSVLNDNPEVKCNSFSVTSRVQPLKTYKEKRKKQQKKKKKKNAHIFHATARTERGQVLLSSTSSRQTA